MTRVFRKFGEGRFAAPPIGDETADSGRHPQAQRSQAEVSKPGSKPHFSGNTRIVLENYMMSMKIESYHYLIILAIISSLKPKMVG